jgi:hypothetical protein
MNAVPLTSNRTGCGCAGSRHVSHAPTAYIGMTMRIHTRSESDMPRGDIASINALALFGMAIYAGRRLRAVAVGVEQPEARAATPV